MSQADPVRSVSSRVWSWMLSALGLVIVGNVVWALVQPLLPVLLVAGAVLLGVAVARRRQRW